MMPGFQAPEQSLSESWENEVAGNASPSELKVKGVRR